MNNIVGVIAVCVVCFGIMLVGDMLGWTWTFPLGVGLIILAMLVSLLRKGGGEE